MVMLRIPVSKRVLYVAVALFLIGFAIAFGGNNPSVMGHSSGEIEVDIPGVGKKTLQKAINDRDLGGGTLACTTRTQSQVIIGRGGSGGSVHATCNAGEVVTGGGCDGAATFNGPYGKVDANGFRCYVSNLFSNYPLTSQAICCR